MLYIQEYHLIPRLTPATQREVAEDKEFVKFAGNYEYDTNSQPGQTEAAGIQRGDQRNTVVHPDNEISLANFSKF